MNQIINQIVAITNLSVQQAWWLLEFVTDKTRAQLQCSPEILTADQQQNLNNYIEQIAVHHKPLAYILGWVPFLDLTLQVAPPTLIPRPETENWVYELIEMLNQSGATKLNILDIGTGSGCIALSLAQALPTAHIWAVDIAASAIELAKTNAQLNNISNITFLQSDLFSTLPANLKFDLIVSNPPYIDPAAQLDASVLDWEDHGALFANNKGICIIEKIARQAPTQLKTNSALATQLVMEIDESQGDIVKKLLENYNFTDVVIKKDQFARNRTVWARQSK